jgi:hypothetical protein
MTTRRVETDRDVEDFLEDHLEGACFAEFCNVMPSTEVTARGAGTWS